MENEVLSRAQKSTTIKSRIRNVGLSLFRQYGYENVSIKMITEAAGVSVGSFYHFFGSKSSLLEDVSFSVNGLFSLPENLDYNKADCKETVLSFYERFCSHMSSLDQEYLSNIFWVKGGNKTLLLANRSYRYLMREMLSSFKAAGKLHPDCSVEELEDIIMTCFFGTTCHWALTESSYSLYGRLRTMLGSIIDSYLA